MNKLLFVLTFLISTTVHAIEQPTLEKPINIDLQNAKLNEVLHLFLKSVFKTEYMLSPEISNDKTPVNLSLKGKTTQQVKEIYQHLLTENGIQSDQVGGVTYLKKASKDLLKSNFTSQLETASIAPSLPQNSPVLDLTQKPTETLKRDDPQISIYKPHHLQPLEIQKVLKFAGLESEISNDMVLYKNTLNNPEIIDALLAKFDGYNNDLNIKAYIFEFNKNTKSQSALQAALNIIKNTATLGLTIPSFGLKAPSLALNLPNFNAVIQNIASNDDFRVISEPTLRVSHNKRTSINVGAEVPVLSQLTVTNQGNPIQNVEYRTSGILFDVLPKIYSDVIELEVLIQISNFVPTTNGVNQTPTLIQRKLQTTLKMKEGETVLMGGLTQARADKSKNTFFGMPIGSSTGDEKTDLLLVLHVL